MSQSFYKRAKLLIQQKGHCYYCDRIVAPAKGTKQEKDTATIDHYIPKSRGGSGLPNNQVMACYQCNQEKGSMTGQEFIMTFIRRA